MPNKEETEKQMLKMLLDSVVPMSTMKMYPRILIYGEGGVGKTKMGAEFGDKVIYIEADPQGWSTLSDWPELKAKMTYMPYKGLSQLDTLCMAYNMGDPFWTSHDTIFIDTHSAVAVKDLNVVYRTRPKSEISDLDFGAPTQPDIGVMTNRVADSLLKLSNLPVQLILTAHVRDDKDAKTGVTTLRPGYMPALRQHIERNMTLVGYLSTIETGDGSGGTNYERALQVRPTRQVSAKCKIKGLPVTLENPNLAEIVNEWVAKGAVEQEDTQVYPDNLGIIHDPETTTGLDI